MTSATEINLPLLAEEATLSLDEKSLKNFREALKQEDEFIPPTFFIKGLSGMFQILNELKVDWQKLLHIQQSFEYLQPISSTPAELKTKTSLIKIRERGNQNWYYFETLFVSFEKTFVKASSTILVSS